MTLDEVIDLINDYIVENHNQEITGDILNGVLLAMLQQPNELIGDLSDLTTGDNANIVEAINWIVSNLNNGSQVHVGEDNPNVTPPSDFAIGDFYSQIDEFLNPVALYVYTGTSWVNLAGYITKESEQWLNFILSGTGGLPTLVAINENQRFINITGNPSGTSSLGGYHNAGGSIPTSIFWSGMTVKVHNATASDQVIKHNYSSAAIKFLFPQEEDYIIKPNETAIFTYRGGALEFESVIVVLEEDVFADVSVGSIDAGDTVAEGTTFTEFVKLLLNKIFYPTFTPYSISGNAGGAVEVGTSTKTITVNFTRGDIVGDLDSGVWNPTLWQGNVLGDATKYWINGEDNGTNPTKSVSVLTTLGTNTVDIAVDYAEGDQPKDSKGNDYLTPEPSGTLNGTATWQGFYYRTAIAGNSAPIATDVRNNYTARRNNAGVINLHSGTTNVRFDVFVPQGSSITQVLDTGNLNLNITSEFVLQGSDFSGLDANGDEVLYKHYVRIIDNPYTVNSVLEITVT